MTRRVGDKVFARHGGSWLPGTISKVTPKGVVTWQMDGCTDIYQFGPDRRRRGQSRLSWLCDSLDDKSFDERQAILAREKRIREAAIMLNSMRDQDCIRSSFNWLPDIEDLKAAEAAYRAILDKAAALIAAIDEPEVQP